MFEKYKQHIKLAKAIQNGNNHTTEENYAVSDLINEEIKVNLEYLKNTFNNSNDIIFREFELGLSIKARAFLCFIEGISNIDNISQFILQPLFIDIGRVEDVDGCLPDNLLIFIKEKVLSISKVKETKLLKDVTEAILSGDAVLFIDGYGWALIIEAKKWEGRNISEPSTEVTIRGPHEGFTETIRTNTSLLRRKIKNSNLIFESLNLGKQTNTIVNIVYIKGIANDKIVEEVRKRLNKIDNDSIIESGYIEQFIEDNPFSPFATIGNSERVDKVAAKILEGRVAILCDGTPYVLTVPFLFIEAIQVPEDYYSRPFATSYIRLIRFGAFLITLFLPAFYVALQTFHIEMIPTVLLITSASSREGIPFPTIVETLLMTTMFELLRESGIRLPKQIGQAVSIVGALIIGQAAVEAGIISAPMVIVSAVTGICSFLVVPMLDAIILSRLILILLAGSLGLYGLVIGFIFLLAHMCSLRSFGAPYLAPFAPTRLNGLKDTLLRFPMWLLKTRPKSITWKDSKRQGDLQMPTKPPLKNKRGDNN